jgi:YihY family inner membrane protein
MAGSHGAFARAAKSLDDFQQSHQPLSVIMAVIRRSIDDRATRLAALITFYGFLSVFPILLLVVTVATALFGESQLRRDIVSSALNQFPVIGDALGKNLHAIAVGNSLAVAIALVGIIWGALGITNSLQFSSAAVWRIPRAEQRSLPRRLVVGLGLLGVLGAAVILSTVAAGVAVNGVEQLGLTGPLGRAAVLAAVVLVNAAGYLMAFRLLTPPGHSWRSAVPGTIVGAVGWTLLQTFGGWLIGHRLAHATALYGLFAIVLGLIFWINLGAQLFLYSTELNVVLTQREWPRSLRRVTA